MKSFLKIKKSYLLILLLPLLFSVYFIFAKSNNSIFLEQNLKQEDPYRAQISQKYPKTLKSKFLDITFNIPNGVESQYSQDYDTNESFEFKKGYRMRIDISKDNPYCPAETTRSTDVYLKDSETTVLLANQIELIFPANDRDWRRGWVGNTAVKHIDGKCMMVYREENGEVEKIFDQILTSAKFN